MRRCACWRNFLSASFASSGSDGFSEVVVVSVPMDPAWRLASSKRSIIINFTRLSVFREEEDGGVGVCGGGRTPTSLSGETPAMGSFLSFASRARVRAIISGAEYRPGGAGAGAGVLSSYTAVAASSVWGLLLLGSTLVLVLGLGFERTRPFEFKWACTDSSRLRFLGGRRMTILVASFDFGIGKGVGSDSTFGVGSWSVLSAPMGPSGVRGLEGPKAGGDGKDGFGLRLFWRCFPFRL